MKITEDWIVAQAPNATAVQNGRKLSQKGSFSQLGRTEDALLFWAECAGSGKNPYHTSIDFTNEDTPTCRCSCPSRQFPCKHAVGLMFEILAQKPFAVAQVPDDLAEKRAKQAAKVAKKEKEAQTPEKPKRTNNAAKVKKIKKQLEGLEKAEQMVSDLLFHGLGTLTGSSAKSYEKLAKDLGSYYLVGAQTAFIRLANEVEKIQKNTEKTDYQEAIRILIRLNAMLQKSKAFLQEKLDKKEYDMEDNLLYEALGGIWKLDELEKIGSFQEDAQLVQLSFDVLFDDAKKEYIDRGYWMNLDNGNIYQTCNYRPIKALKYIKAEDTCFEVVHVPKLFYYPGSGNQRVRWDGCTMEPMDSRTLEKVIQFAQTDWAQVIKQVKNEIKNTLSEKYLAVAIGFHKIGKVQDELVLENQKGERIILRDRVADGEDHASVRNLEWLPDMEQKENQVLFGFMFYDSKDARLCMQPYSIITKEQIFRLQY